MVQSVRCVKCAAVRRAQAPALAQMFTASATRARRSSKAFNGARHRASMLQSLRIILSRGHRQLEDF
ncbi:hypothetical protein HaLaN_31396 [Haematococcus lacustris]|uniref:Uncharacterized protein n=1 Tax=Haematococcus lacustris TaxID=44745 RepID=A0A6A0AHR7_HAELA|nr:hypothetical protein HaLaN_31396 [Haematococcus lacustris]